MGGPENKKREEEKKKRKRKAAETLFQPEDPQPSTSKKAKSDPSSGKKKKAPKAGEKDPGGKQSLLVKIPFPSAPGLKKKEAQEAEKAKPEGDEEDDSFEYDRLIIYLLLPGETEDARNVKPVRTIVTVSLILILC